MKVEGKAKLLRIFIGESDKIGTIPVYERIVVEARKAGLSGATVYKGIMGFGSTSKIHTAKILALSADMPLVIEIVDKMEKIEGFLPVVDKIFEETDAGGLITMEHAEIIKYTFSKIKE